MADLIFRHKETRLNTVSSIPASTVAIRLPAHGAPTWSSRTTQKRPLPVEVPPAEDETAFKQRYLASAASIYHRQYHTGRSFLWKVLEDGKVFSIQAVDFAGELDASKAASGHLTLRFYLPSPIRPGCVALADSLKHDVLNVFFLTESNHLYTLTLRPEFFRRRSSTEDNVPEWCHTFHPAAFSFRHPHRLIAIDADELLVSTHEGALLRLERAAHGVSPAWKETTHNAGGWKGFKSIIPFQSSNTIRYGKANLDLSAVTSMVVHPMQQEKTKLAFTVSLDHRLRVWNLGSNKLAYVGDLLNQERAPSEMGKYIIHPSQSHLIRVYEMGDEKALVVTYSPAGTGQFKYWEATLQIDGSVELEDAFPDLVLEPPTPTSDVWTLADFAVAIDFGDALNVAHWVLWKNNTVYRVQRVELRLDSPEYTMNQWGAEWTAVATETLLDVPLPAVISTDSADVTEKWVEHILLPGRFSASTIDTALSIYEKGMGVSKTISSAREPRSLAKRMCSLIASHITLEQTADGGMEYEKFRAATDAQWRRFYRLILELDKQRGEALALSFDPIYQMSWVVTADGLTCIRDCSAMEQVWHNQDVLPTSSRQLIARLVSAAAALRDSLRDGVLQTCDSAVAAEVFSDLSGTSMASLENLYDACALSGQISDEDYDRLVNTFGNDMQGLSIEVYEGLLNTMTAAEELHQRLRQVPLAPFGIKAVIKGVHETLELHRSICLDQLVLLLFLACEADEKIELDIVAAYNMLMTMLKRLELLQWLLKNQLNMPLPQSDLPSPSKKDTAEEMKTVTVLEGCIAHLVGLVTHTDESTSSLLTDILVRICNPDGEYELQPALIQCFLLKMERSDLAVEFSRFANQDPFSTYIQGRVFLAARDLTTAATYFQRAAFGLAHPDPKISAERHSAGLLDDTEWQLLYAGLPRYYYHILSLFDKEKFYPQVTEFARIALQFISPTSREKYLMDLYPEVQSRLFNAAIQISRFDIAYSVLVLFKDRALQHSSLRTLIFRMCESQSVAQLLDFPFLGLRTEVDEILEDKCHTIVDVNAGVPYHKILYSWHMKQGDFRAAAGVCLERLKRLQQAGEGDKVTGHRQGVDEFETPVTQQYLMLINALSCVDPKQRWFLVEPLPLPTGKGPAVPEKRKVVTLEQMRKAYQDELDRIAAIGNNQFALVGGDEMEL